MLARAQSPEILERQEAREALQTLTRVRDAHPRVYLLPDSDAVGLPSSAVKPLLQILALLAAGESPTVLSQDAELTTQEAADFLNVSRPTLLKRLDDGEIPYRWEGTHRRIRAVAVVAYREARDQASLQALRELVAEEEELGLRD